MAKKRLTQCRSNGLAFFDDRRPNFRDQRLQESFTGDRRRAAKKAADLDDRPPFLMNYE
jgi:hypothetical protein